MIRALLQASGLPALLFSWLGLGIEGVGNVYAALLGLLALTSPLLLLDSSITRAAAQARSPRLVGLVGRAYTACSLLLLVWLGHFGLAAMLSWCWGCSALHRACVEAERLTPPQDQKGGAA